MSPQFLLRSTWSTYHFSLCSLCYYLQWFFCFCSTYWVRFWWLEAPGWNCCPACCIHKDRTLLSQLSSKLWTEIKNAKMYGVSYCTSSMFQWEWNSLQVQRILSNNKLMLMWHRFMQERQHTQVYLWSSETPNMHRFDFGGARLQKSRPLIFERRKWTFWTLPLSKTPFFTHFVAKSGHFLVDFFRGCTAPQHPSSRYWSGYNMYTNTSKYNQVVTELFYWSYIISSRSFKGKVSDSKYNNILLWHESEDVNKKKKKIKYFNWFQFYVYLA